MASGKLIQDGEILLVNSKEMGDDGEMCVLCYWTPSGLFQARRADLVSIKSARDIRPTQCDIVFLDDDESQWMKWNEVTDGIFFSPLTFILVRIRIRMEAELMDPSTASSVPVVLITGFGPFRSIMVNPSWEIAQALKQYVEWTTPVHIITEQIPVVYDEVSNRIPNYWLKYNPTVRRILSR